MKPPRLLIPLVLAVALALVLLQKQQGQDSARVNEEKLWQHRNLGKAFYENPTTQQQGPLDSRLWSGMSYIRPEDTSANCLTSCNYRPR